MEFTKITDTATHPWHEAKASMADDLLLIVKDIIESDEDENNTLRDIIKLARLLDIAAPANRTTASTITNPAYNLLDYIKRNAGSRLLKEIDADELLFDKEKPFTCIGQIQEIFHDVSEKLSKSLAVEPQYA